MFSSSIQLLLLLFFCIVFLFGLSSPLLFLLLLFPLALLGMWDLVGIVTELITHIAFYLWQVILGFFSTCSTSSWDLPLLSHSVPRSKSKIFLVFFFFFLPSFPYFFLASILQEGKHYQSILDRQMANVKLQQD